MPHRSSDFPASSDRQPFHMDEAAAQPTFFQELVASGWHTTAMTMQLIVETLPLSHGIIGSGVDELRWPRPVRPGDTLRLHCEILAVTPSKLHLSRGTVRGADDHPQPEGSAGANNGCEPARISPARARGVNADRSARSPAAHRRGSHVKSKRAMLVQQALRS
jgi:hypothetical protein